MRSLPGAGIALFALLIAACASSPVTLVALPAAPHAAQVQGGAEGAGTTVLLRPVLLPRYLDAYPVLVGHEGNPLICFEQDGMGRAVFRTRSRVCCAVRSRNGWALRAS